MTEEAIALACREEVRKAFAAMPIRIQLRRTKGWRMPPNTVSVSRGPGRKWGNPYRVGSVDPRTGRVLDAAGSVGKFYESLVLGRLAISEADVIRELKGKNLACWCPLPKAGEPDICHAAVLLEIANAAMAEEIEKEGMLG